MTEPTSATAYPTPRRTERVFLRIPIEVQGRDTRGDSFSERTHTLIINRTGARISLEQSVKPNATLEIVNLQTAASCPFRVVGRTGKSLGGRPEWGVECLRPDIDFWGISFPPNEAPAAAREPVDALLECSACHARELAKLSLDDFHIVSAQGALERECGHCAGKTQWRLNYCLAPDQDSPPWQADANPESSPAVGINCDKAAAKRLPVKLPLRVRLPDGREEATRTENLSSTGLCFISGMEMKSGDLVILTLSYVPGTLKGKEVWAKVVWWRVMEGTHRFIYGVRLVGDERNSEKRSRFLGGLRA